LRSIFLRHTNVSACIIAVSNKEEQVASSL